MLQATLDDLDKKILALLKADSSKSFKEIADIVGKTEATVRRRVKRLKDDDYIKKFTVVLNEKKINDKKVKATIKIVPEVQETKSIANRISDLELVTEAYLLSGECGILVVVSAESVETLTDFIENDLGSIPGIKTLDTCFIMKNLKEDS
jgi:DNA-binding Lrp family transcriptional regulator